jgi:hypothetical protein
MAPKKFDKLAHPETSHSVLSIQSWTPDLTPQLSYAYFLSEMALKQQEHDISRSRNPYLVGG